MLGGERETRIKFARKMLSTRHFWCVKHGVGVAISYLGTNRNVTADEVARLAEGDLPSRGIGKRITRATVPDKSWEFSQFAPHLDWDRVRVQRPPLELTEDIIAF